MSFDQLGLSDKFLPFFNENKFTKPTAVQNKSIPLFLEGKSVTCIAETGSGKTLAYALPIAHLIKNIENEVGVQNKKGSPYALILTPTRELGLQIEKVFKSISHHVKIRARLMASNTGTKNTKILKTTSFEVLIATPNRVKTALRDRDLSLDHLKYIVFDEADELFSMGFKRDIDSILNHTPSEIQMGLFTATMSNEIDLYIGEKFQDQKILKVDLQGVSTKPKRVETYNIFVDFLEKNSMTKLFLENTAKGRGIIFCNQKNHVDDLAKFLSEKMPKAKFRILHGDLDKKEREKNYKDFRDKKVQFLVATDIAARGLDISDLWWVYNHGIPKKAEYYLHRAGRVARVNRKGVVYNLVTPRDSRFIEIINDSIKHQSILDIDIISKSLNEHKKKKIRKKVIEKRVKETKRTKIFGTKKKVVSKKTAKKVQKRR